jgi:hypothetical protein
MWITLPSPSTTIPVKFGIPGLGAAYVVSGVAAEDEEIVTSKAQKAVEIFMKNVYNKK